MRRLLYLPIAALSFLALPAAPAGGGGGRDDVNARPAVRRQREPFEDAVDRGLQFLAKSQANDGSWVNNGGVMMPQPWPGRPGMAQPRSSGDLAVTALSVMAFLSAGHVPGEGRYGPIVEGGIRWVMSQQQGDGKLVPRGGGPEMYYHGICTLMLAEAVGMTDRGSAEEMRVRLEAAVKVILFGQRTRGAAKGGWRYQVSSGGIGGEDADLSVVGWALMALRAAKNVGCDVPHSSIEAAVDYVKRCHSRNGGFLYQAGPGINVTVPCTGVGILCLELSGKEYHLCDEVLQAGSYLLKNKMNARNPIHFFYGCYYTSQAMFQLGGNYWDGYRPTLHSLLLRENAPQTDGSWMCHGGEAAYGSAYSTSMAILALTVEYRYLPIYQRFEEPLERDARD